MELPVISFSPSKLETFRKYIDEEYNGFFTKEMIIDEIKGIRKSSKKADFGTAIHEILEHGYSKYYDAEKGVYIVGVEDRETKEVTNFTFSDADLGPVKLYYDTHTNAVNEISMELHLKVKGYLVKIRMRIDQMIGNIVIDHKTSDKEPKIDDFERSLQWQAYLIATEANIFNYNFFTCKQPKRDNPNGRIYITNLEWQFFRYPDMEIKFKQWCTRFIDFCQVHGLMDYLKYKEYKGVL